MELSRATIEQEIYSAIISCEPRSGAVAASVAADVIWAAVAKHIEETENRIIDAEFALQELKSKTEDRQLAK